MEKRMVIEMEENLHSAVKSLAYKQGRTVKDVVVELLEKWVKDNE